MLKSTKTEKLQDLTAVNFNNIEDERYENLLKAIHQGLYSKTFPLPEEQESVEDWIARSKKENRVPRQFISAHFTDLDQALRLSDEIAALKEIQEKTTEQESQLQNLQTQFDALTVAFVVGEQYQGTGAASVNYAIRNKDYDGKTQGKPRYAAKDFVDHQVRQYQDFAKENNETIVLVTWEANNPRLTPFFDRYGKPDFTVDVMDPARRVEILERNYGAQNIGFQWVQPPLSSEQEGCASLLLYSYPVLGLSPTLEQKVVALNNFVDAFYKTFPVEGKFQENPPRPPLQYAEFCEKRALELSGITLPQTSISELEQAFLLQKYKSSENKENKESAIAKLKEFIFEKEKDSNQDSKSKIEAVVREQFKGISDIEAAHYVKFMAKDLATELQESAADVRQMVQGLEKMKENPKEFAGEAQSIPKQESENARTFWQQLVARESSSKETVR